MCTSVPESGLEKKSQFRQNWTDMQAADVVSQLGAWSAVKGPLQQKLAREHVRIWCRICRWRRCVFFCLPDTVRSTGCRKRPRTCSAIHNRDGNAFMQSVRGYMRPSRSAITLLVQLKRRWKSSQNAVGYAATSSISRSRFVVAWAFPRYATGYLGGIAVPPNPSP